VENEPDGRVLNGLPAACAAYLPQLSAVFEAAGQLPYHATQALRPAPAVK